MHLLMQKCSMNLLESFARQRSGPMWRGKSTTVLLLTAFSRQGLAPVICDLQSARTRTRRRAIMVKHVELPSARPIPYIREFPLIGSLPALMRKDRLTFFVGVTQQRDVCGL